MAQQIIKLLGEIRDRQREALELQRRHVDLYLAQLERVERIHDRAEALQRKAGKAIAIVLALAFVLVLALLVLRSAALGGA
jgi:hypothetical protein